jgi:hypothetical protein
MLGFADGGLIWSILMAILGAVILMVCRFRKTVFFTLRFRFFASKFLSQIFGKPSLARQSSFTINTSERGVPFASLPSRPSHVEVNR